MERVPVHVACGASRPLVGMVHLPPVRRVNDVEPALAAAARDARALADGGADAIMVENFGDAPFAKTVAPHTTAVLAVAARDAREATGLPVGVNALRNDWRAALGAAAAAGATFVRVNVLAGAAFTDQGYIEGEAAGVDAYRRTLGVRERVAVLADVFSKHATPVPGATLEQAAGDAWTRAGADGLLVTGTATGEPADAGDVACVRRAAAGAPVLVASGVTPSHVHTWATVADGLVVGTALKEGGRVDAPVDPARVSKLQAAWRAAVKDT